MKNGYDISQTPGTDNVLSFAPQDQLRNKESTAMMTFGGNAPMISKKNHCSNNYDIVKEGSIYQS
eukprot:CAMPEP_0170557188 /NCGR_PEP_ID=MMETSP0211-20121228/19266_1 /TAXON_ID=311385 /ORGANISM="Pseudokeronopsis sp., Strain OXSARD2" /LENGTH=64 /DNA_ID=CAMNT_0010867955 /DNA_START=315 /DNA_END=509 /DNA_ORIENTATION=-